MAWPGTCLAIAREKSGDFKSSIRGYETALKLIPDQLEIANNLGRLAFPLGMTEIAAQLFANYLVRYPASVEAANNLACALRELNRYGEAIEALRPAIGANPEEAGAVEHARHRAGRAGRAGRVAHLLRPRLGTDGYPWYPQARAFTPATFNQWGPVVARLRRRSPPISEARNGRLGLGVVKA